MSIDAKDYCRPLSRRTLAPEQVAAENAASAVALAEKLKPHDETEFFPGGLRLFRVNEVYPYSDVFFEAIDEASQSGGCVSPREEEIILDRASKAGFIVMHGVPDRLALVMAPAQREPRLEPGLKILREKLEAITHGTFQAFIEGLSPIHAEYHNQIDPQQRGKIGGHSLGLISFHHELGRAYNMMRAREGLPPIQPIKMPSFTSAPTLARFVDNMINWHESVGSSPHIHMHSAHPEAALMDPFASVKHELLWQIHEAMDRDFMSFLEQNGIDYETINHEQT